MDEKRRARKDEHIENYLRSEFRSKTLLNNVYVEHNALSEINLEIRVIFKYFAIRFSYTY